MAVNINLRADKSGQEWTFFFTEERFKSTTVLQLKTKLTEIQGIPEEHLRLTFSGQQLADHRLLTDCGVKHGDHLIVGLTGRRDSEGRNQASGFPVGVQSAAEAPDTTEMAVKVRVSGDYRREEEIIGLCDTEEQLKRMTVLQLKEKLASAFGLPGYSVHLIFGHNSHLDEDALLSAYGIQHMSEIHMLVSMIHMSP